MDNKLRQQSEYLLSQEAAMTQDCFRQAELATIQNDTVRSQLLQNPHLCETVQAFLEEIINETSDQINTAQEQ